MDVLSYFTNWKRALDYALICSKLSFEKLDVRQDRITKLWVVRARV